MTTYVPALDGTPEENAAELHRLLANPAGRLQLPEGRHVVAGGLVLTDGWTLAGIPGDGPAGAPRATLVQAAPAEDPFVHVLGSRVGVEDVALQVPAAHPGMHDGDRWTAVTVGRYLYRTDATWLEGVAIRRVHVIRVGRCPANAVAVMGAVRDLHVADVRVQGGGTGLAVHWGAVGRDVSTLTGPSYHPHRLRLRDLTVTGAYEAFYLSSVHDVSVRGVRANDVEIGFRLLPGDNTDRLHDDTGASPVSRGIEIRDCELGWSGRRYALRVAGWGRSEIDHRVTRLDYRDLTVDDIRIRPQPVRDRNGHTDPRVAVVVENAGPVRFGRIRLGHSPGVQPARVDGEYVPLSALTR
ncbi:MAG: hypothetical protein J2P24_03425 [Streptosporangiales bacterium]|nr:hypothetical protein [Streptosporangiales bacterium]MBO0891289.1 hypothetical protein [Acidothermales bacterium]